MRHSPDHGESQVKLYFAGAENLSLRKALLDAGVRRMTFSFLRAYLDNLSLDLHPIPSTVELLVDAGASHANENPDLMNEQGWRDYEHLYVSWLQGYTRFALVSEFDFLAFGREHLEHMRDEVWSQLDPEVFLPVWHSEDVEELAERYRNLAFTGDALKRTPGLRERATRAVRRFGTRVHGLAFTSPRAIEDVPVDSVSSTSWTAPMRFGETCVWDGQKLNRYNGSLKQEARQRHREDILRAGFDYDAVLADDRHEVTRLAIWSWQQWEEHMNRTRPTPSEMEPRAPITATPALGPAPSTGQGRKKLLPILDVITPVHRLEDGSEIVGSPEVQIRASSARRCDTCYIKSLCPEFAEGEGCAFDIPVELRTKDQLVALLRGMIEMQSQRVAFARYAEELEGGAPSKTVSAELDRLFNLTQRLKDIQDEREFLKLSVETRGQAGILSRIFGERIGEEARALNNPLGEDATNHILAEVIDAQVIE